MQPQEPDGETTVVVFVTRTGGVAGVRRAWRAAPTDEQAPVFLDLIAQCPWDEDETTETVADGFQWTIRARADHEDERTADLDDAQLTGAWRELVDAVRAWARAAR